MVFQEPHELLAGELTALVDVEDVPTAIAGQASWTASVQKSVVSGLASRHANIRQLARSGLRRVIQATRHRNVRDISRPNMV
jgi:hypothetical protein